MTLITERYELAPWQNDLEGIFGRPYKLRLIEGKFHATSRTEQFGDVKLVSLYTQSAVVIRSGIIRSIPRSLYHIFFIESGEMLFDNGARAPAHTMTLVDGHHAYHARQSPGFRSLVASVPAAVMRTRIPDIDRRCGAIIDSREGGHRVLHDYLACLMEQAHTLSVGLRETAGSHILDLLCADTLGSAAHHKLAQCPRRFIAAHIADPGLTPKMAAQALGMSVGTIHARMAKIGTSFCQEVRAQRLARCARDLRSSEVDSSITEIALRWGFSSVSGFSRVFKQHFGSSPRAYRRSMPAI